MDTAKSALDSVKEACSELEAGWTAAFDGTITACDIYPGEQTSLLSSALRLRIWIPWWLRFHSANTMYTK